jgi:hypothetical protein
MTKMSVVMMTAGVRRRAKGSRRSAIAVQRVLVGRVISAIFQGRKKEGGFPELERSNAFTAFCSGSYDRRFTFLDVLYIYHCGAVVFCHVYAHRVPFGRVQCLWKHKDATDEIDSN